MCVGHDGDMAICKDSDSLRESGTNSAGTSAYILYLYNLNKE